MQTAFCLCSRYFYAGPYVAWLRLFSRARSPGVNRGTLYSKTLARVNYFRRVLVPRWLVSQRRGSVLGLPITWQRVMISACDQPVLCKLSIIGTIYVTDGQHARVQYVEYYHPLTNARTHKVSIFMLAVVASCWAACLEVNKSEADCVYHTGVLTTRVFVKIILGYWR